MAKKVGRPVGSKTQTYEKQKIQKPTCPKCKSTDAIHLGRQGNVRRWQMKTPFGDPANACRDTKYECRECHYKWLVQTWSNKGEDVAQTQGK